MLYKYPYTNLYNLNLDWLIQAVKELQEIVEPLENVVTSVNGMTGNVELTREILTQILGGMVSKFNGRNGDVTLTAEDVNDTLIDITWTSDPGDVIGDLTQAELDEMYQSGKRILIFVNNVSVADTVYFLQYYDGHAQPQLYSPTSALAGVVSFNGQTGAVTATGSNLATASNDQTPIAETLSTQSSRIGTLSQLETADKTNLVSAVNEVLESVVALGPYNGTDSGSTTAALAAAQGKALAEDIEDLGTELNSQSQQIDNLNDTDNSIESGLFIVANGDTHAAIASGQYVYIKNHSDITEGLYKASTAIGTNGALYGNVNSADANGELNIISSAISDINSTYINVIYGLGTVHMTGTTYSVHLNNNQICIMIVSTGTKSALYVIGVFSNRTNLNQMAGDNLITQGEMISNSILNFSVNQNYTIVQIWSYNR